MAGYGKAFLNGTWPLIAGGTANTFKFNVIHGNGSGAQAATVRAATVASAAASGTATLASIPATAAAGSAVWTFGTDVTVTRPS